MAYRSRNDLHSHILTEEEVEELIGMWKSGATLKEMSKHFDVHYNTVGNIINRYINDQRAKD